MTRKKSKTSALRRFHRWIGALAALFVVFMVVSGLALNHSNGLGLDRDHVSQSYLLDWYGLAEPEYIRSFAVGEHWLSFAGSQLYLDGNTVTTLSNGVGAVASDGVIIAAGREELLLLDDNGHVIERLPWEQTGGGPIESFGRVGDRFVAAKSGDLIWTADTNLLKWEHYVSLATSPIWSTAGTAPGEILQAITHEYRGRGLSMERLLLDFHSGRVFGEAGRLVYDLLALAVGFLALSGLLMWLRGWRNGNGNGGSVKTRR